MDKNNFIKNTEGLYEVQGCVEPQTIVQMAADILLESITAGEPLSSAKSAAAFLQMALANEENEHFAVLFLDRQHCVISFETLFTGTIDSAPVFPRVVVKKALMHNAAAVILAHNHPSGSAEPSDADKVITTRLCDALQLIDVTVLDHFIVTKHNHTSFAELGLI